MAYSYWMSLRRQRARGLGADGRMGLRDHLHRRQARHLDAGLGRLEPYPTDAKVSATTLRHGNFDYVTNTVKWDPTITNHDAAELALPDPEAGLLRRRERLHLAMGGPGGSDQALHAAGQGALRRRDAVHAALSAEASRRGGSEVKGRPRYCAGNGCEIAAGSQRCPANSHDDCWRTGAGFRSGAVEKMTGRSST